MCVKSTPGASASVPPQSNQREEVKPQKWGSVTFDSLGRVRLAGVAFSFEISGIRWATMGKEEVDVGLPEEGRGG